MAVKTRDQIKALFESGDKPTQQDFADWLDSIRFKNESLPINQVTFGMNPLTCAATTVWDFEAGNNASVTLNQNTALSITNVQSGVFFTLVIKQDATGGRTMTLPAGSKVGFLGAGVITLSTLANAIDILTGFYDGTNYFWQLNKSFT